MIIKQHLEDYPLPTPVVLTIGYFDGIHLGHQSLLKRLNEIGAAEHIPKAVITFSNHPSSVLRPDSPICSICTAQHKLRLLEENGVDFTIIIPFTKQFAEQTAEQFLNKVNQHLPFSHLILGYDAKIGKDRQGDPQSLITFSQKSGIDVEYIEEFKEKNHRFSSSRLRELIHHGDFKEASYLMARPYSIYTRVIAGIGKGKILGFPTANLEVQGLCLPPQGVYAVKAIVNGVEREGVANLGLAPTIGVRAEPLLEVHLYNDKDQDLYGKAIEVIFIKFLRAEEKFNSLEALSAKIAEDISKAKIALHKNS